MAALASPLLLRGVGEVSVQVGVPTNDVMAWKACMCAQRSWVVMQDWSVG
jgi:hypothetical protein